MRNAIIFFASLPPAGARHPLAAELGHDRADRLTELFYEDCVERLHGSAGIIVCYDPRVPVERYRALLGGDCRYIAQTGAMDSERIDNAFRFAFEQAYDRALAVGIACPDLPTETFGAAFTALASHPACAGEIKEGGLYLLGLAKQAFEPEVFADVSFTLAGGFAADAAKLERRFDSMVRLPVWPGVETAQSLKTLYRRNFDSAFTGSKTFAYLRENAGEVGVGII